MTDFREFLIGDCAVWMGGSKKNLILKITYWGIGVFQRVLRRNRKGRNAVHAAIRVEPPRVEKGYLSTEWPVTIKRDIRVPKGERLSIMRYKRRNEITPAGWMLLYQLANEAVGKHYDPLDLLEFVTRFFGVPDIPDLGDDNNVCSTTVAKIIEQVCLASGLPSPFPKGWRSVTPADLICNENFENVLTVDG